MLFGHNKSLLFFILILRTSILLKHLSWVGALMLIFTFRICFPHQSLHLNCLDFPSQIKRYVSCRGRDCMVVGFTTTVQSVPITTKVVSSNPIHDKVYSIQHYVIGALMLIFTFRICFPLYHDYQTFLYRGDQFYWWRKPPTCCKSLTNFIT
jgi:hypothetical protein